MELACVYVDPHKSRANRTYMDLLPRRSFIILSRCVFLDVFEKKTLVLGEMFLETSRAGGKKSQRGWPVANARNISLTV